MTKKRNIFFCFLYSFSIFVVSSFILITCKDLLRGETLGYNIGYVIIITILYSIYRKKIKEDFKNFKTDFKKVFPKAFIVSIILIALETIIALVLGKLGISSPNQMYATELLRSNKLMILYSALLGPVFEELCFRLPYHYSTNNKLITFITYTVLFATVHLLSVSDILSLLYIIPYLLLGFGIAYPFYKSDNILMSTIVHIINNSLGIMLILI